MLAVELWLTVKMKEKHEVKVEAKNEVKAEKSKFDASNFVDSVEFAKAKETA